MSNSDSNIEPMFQGQLVRKLQSVDNPLMFKDVWDGEKDLGKRVHKHLGNKRLFFGEIKQPWLQTIAKQYILYRSGQNIKFLTLHNDLQGIRDLSRFFEEQSVFSFDDIDDYVLDALVSNLYSHCAPSTRANKLSIIKNFFENGTINGWFNISVYVFAGLFTRHKHHLRPEIKYIPDEVLRQLDEHLHLLPEPIQRLVILIRALGLRAGEILQMRFDCLRQSRDENWQLQFTNWKFNQQLDTLPINETLVNVIKEQQAYIREQLGEDYPYLFCSNSRKGKGFKLIKGVVFAPFTPKPSVMRVDCFVGYLNKLANHCKICDSAGNIWHFTSHQFRRTVATKMTNEGVRRYVVQMYLRHRDPAMLEHYAYVFPTTQKKEFDAFRKHKTTIDINGEVVKKLNPELDGNFTLHWLREKTQARETALGGSARPNI